MSTGFNGTPMPAFVDGLTPEQRWAITDYIVSLSGSDGPRYTNLVVAKPVRDPIDLSKGAASFAAAPVARFPIIGQIMEPGRAFRPPATSVTVQAIYDAESIALLVRWHDRTAEKTGQNGPSLPVPPEEEVVSAPAAAEAAGGEPVRRRGGRAGGPRPAARTRSPRPTAPAAQPPSSPTPSRSRFPSEVPTGARKPYFIFGDGQSPVDLWFFDLAQAEPLRFTGKGSADVTAERRGGCHRRRQLRPGRMVGHLQAAASPRRRGGVHARSVPADRVLGLGRVLARAWQPARSHAVVLALPRTRERPLARRPDDHDGARHPRHRAGDRRLGAVAFALSRPREELGGERTQQPAASV